MTVAVRNGGRAVRRCLALAALALAVAGLGGCSSGLGPADAQGTFTPLTAGTLTVATADIPTPGFWEGSFERPSGGFEAELAAALAERFELRLRVVEVPWQRILAGDLGAADIAISDVTATPERAKAVRFSHPYLPAPPAVLAQAGTEVPDVHTARELTWAVQDATTLADALEQTIRPDADPEILASEPAVVEALTAGDVEAALIDLPIALAYARESDGELEVAAQLGGDAHLAVVLPQSSDNGDAVDSAIRALTADGTIERLAEEWLGITVRSGQAHDVRLLRTGS